MKIIGINKMVTLTAEKAKFWVEHQVNQRAVMARHVNGLAKLLARVGWRNDQRICITEDDRIINGLQRLSAIIKIGDFGWKIPVTVFSANEISHDLIESFNVQKGDSLANLMRREYNWHDKRMASICQPLWHLIEDRQNITTNDALSIYEGLRTVFDRVLTVNTPNAKGASAVPSMVSAAAILCGLDGVPLDKFIAVANDYVDENYSSPLWKAFKDWGIEWRSRQKPSGEYLRNEPLAPPARLAARYLALKDFILGKRIRPIKSYSDEYLNATAAHCREMVKNNI